MRIRFGEIGPACARYMRSVLALGRGKTAKNASLVLGANATSAALRLCVLMILARQFPHGGFANLMVFSALMEVVAVFSDMGVSTTVTRYIAMHGDKQPHGCLWRCLRFKGLIVLLCAGGMIAFRGTFLRIQEVGPDFAWLFPLAVIAGFTMSLLGTLLAVLQGLQSYWRYSLAFVVMNALRFGGLGALLYFGAGRIGPAAMIYFLVPVLAVLCGAGLLRSPLRTTHHRPPGHIESRELLTFLAPLGVLQMVSILVMRLPTFMLKGMAPIEAVANYELAYQIGFVFPLITRAMFTVLLPAVSTMKASGQLTQYRKRVLSLYPLVLLATAAGMVLGPPLLTVLMGDKYAQAAPILRVLIPSLGIALLASPLSAILFSVGKTHWVMGVHALQLLTLVPLNLVLIPRWHAMGAAISWIAPATLGVCLTIWLTRKAISELRQSESAVLKEQSVLR